MIKIENLSKDYKTTEHNEVHALSNINVTLPDHGMVFVVGKSGCGKTTLLNLISGLDREDSGSIHILETDVTHFSELDWDEFRNRNISIIFQEHNLIEELSVFDNMMLPLSIRESTDDDINRIYSLLDELDMNDCVFRRSFELSGGQKQRISIARSIVKNSMIILADEPTGNLDEMNAHLVFKMLKSLSRDRLVVVVSHDGLAAKTYADSIIYMSDGKITFVEDINANHIVDQLSITFNHIDVVYDSYIDFYQNFYNHIESIITNSSSQDIALGINISLKKKPDKALQTAQKRPPIILKSMPLSYLLKLILIQMSQRIMRLTTTLIIFVLMSFILMMSGIFTFYNRYQTMGSYVDEYDINTFLLGYSAQFEDPFFEVKSTTINRGYDYFNLIESEFNQEDIIYISNHHTVQDDTHQLDDLVSIHYIQNHQEYQLLIGQLPSQPGQVVLTDYFVDHHNLDNTILGEHILIDGSLYEITGILKTNYIEFKVNDSVSFGDLTPFQQYALDYQYQIVLIHKEDILQQLNDIYYVPLELSDFSTNKMSVYEHNTIIYGSINLYNDMSDELIWGTLPVSDNEVIISSSMARMMGYQDINDYQSLTSTWVFKDVYQPTFNNYYKNFINMYDYFNQGIVITGVYEELSDVTLNEWPDVLINHVIFESIREEYYQYFFMDETMIITSENGREMASIMQQNNLQWDEPNANEIEGVSYLINLIKPILYMLTGTLAVLSLFTIIAMISFRIKDNHHKIGVLRSLGVRRFDIVKLYLYESFAVYSIGYIIALAISATGIYFINQWYRNILEERPFDILKMDIVLVLVVTVIIFCIVIGATLSPIIQFSKKKPIDIIKGQ